MKKHNLEQIEKVKQLSVQMVRIRAGLQQQAVPKDVPPTTKARVAKEISKDDRIAELEFQIAQREAREAKLAQQLSYFKKVSGPQVPGSFRPGSGPQKKLVRATGNPRVAHRVGAPRAPHPSSLEVVPEQTPTSDNVQPPTSASVAQPRCGQATDKEHETLVQMLQAIVLTQKSLLLLAPPSR